MGKYVIIGYYQDYSISDNHWKAKGVNEHILIEDMDINKIISNGREGLEELVKANNVHEISNDVCESTLFDWQIFHKSDVFVDDVLLYLAQRDVDDWGDDMDFACHDYVQAGTNDEPRSEIMFRWAVGQLVEDGKITVEGHPMIHQSFDVVEGEYVQVG